eukprot:7035603-Pyramimonas_sp.AAC.1
MVEWLPRSCMFKLPTAQRLSRYTKRPQKRPQGPKTAKVPPQDPDALQQTWGGSAFEVMVCLQ